MSDNILQLERDQPAADAPASLPTGSEQSAIAGRQYGVYPLDWATTKVKLGKGRVAVLRRPTADEILEREDELQTEIPIGRDGGYALPDPTVNEEIDAKYFDLVKVEVTGYDGEVPEQHKATAFNGLYAREIYVDEAFDLTDETVPVIEEIGSGAEPDFTVVHVMRPPTEGEIKLYRRKSAKGELKPGKRGRQKFVTTSNLKTAMSFYSQWLVKVTGATINGDDTQYLPGPTLTAHVDPLIQRLVVNAVVEAFTAKLSD